MPQFALAGESIEDIDFEAEGACSAESGPFLCDGKGEGESRHLQAAKQGAQQDGSWSGNQKKNKKDECNDARSIPLCPAATGCPFAWIRQGRKESPPFL
jgi:hypothetical protein